jgi:hypothetical protein
MANGVTSIGSSAFQFTSLATVDIPASVTTIGNSAFANIKPLRRVTVHSCNSAILGLELSNHFAGASSLAAIVYPGGSCTIDGIPTVNAPPLEGILSLPQIVFPATKYGRTSTRTVTAKNVGTAPFTPFGPIGLTTGGYLQDYSYVTTCGNELAVDASCSITVTFAPTLAGMDELDNAISFLDWKGYSEDNPIQQRLLGSIDTDDETWAITVSSGSNGSISPASSTEIVDGSNVTYTITPNSGYQIDTVTVDSSNISTSALTTISGQTKSYTFNAVSSDHTIAVTFKVISSQPIVVYDPPKPIPYLKTLTAPKMNAKDGKLVCTSGTYTAGWILNGVIQGSPAAIYSPATYTYNLLINGFVQTPLAITSPTSSIVWEMQQAPSGSVISCAVTAGFNSLTNTDRSNLNTPVIITAMTTQAQSIATAESIYSATASLNFKIYQTTIADNRVKWRKEIEASRTAYYEELDRIKSLGNSKLMNSLKSAALKSYIAAQKKIATDYQASQPIALAVKDAENRAALQVKMEAIVQANATYGAYIESIGYGVLIP